ncbi:MAG: 3'-5' exonuclease [Flavobacteriales bacterium]|nr:3'-5' exonuclease [Flavobacteriales bacterium]|tara:strand:+ start:4919 stop:5500 length:582 start_codon:yes stop_codon:yes gene_type:complete
MNKISKFKKVISKEEIALLELGKYSGEIILVESSSHLDRVCLELSKCSLIGIDTETKPTFKKGHLNPVALLQMATDKKVYVIRLLKTSLTDQLASIFSSTRIIKVGIAVRDDLKDLKKMYPFEEKNIVDLNILAPELGFESIGAKKLSALVLGIRISKKQQVSNWEAKELSTAQIDYAATDAWICREIYLRLQ